MPVAPTTVLSAAVGAGRARARRRRRRPTRSCPGAGGGELGGELGVALEQVLEEAHLLLEQTILGGEDGDLRREAGGLVVERGVLRHHRRDVRRLLRAVLGRRLLVRLAPPLLAHRVARVLRREREAAAVGGEGVGAAVERVGVGEHRERLLRAVRRRERLLRPDRARVVALVAEGRALVDRRQRRARRRVLVAARADLGVVVERRHVLGEALRRRLVRQRLGAQRLELREHLLEDRAHRRLVDGRAHLAHQRRLERLAARLLLDLEQPDQVRRALAHREPQPRRRAAERRDDLLLVREPLVVAPQRGLGDDRLERRERDAVGHRLELGERDVLLEGHGARLGAQLCVELEERVF